MSSYIYLRALRHADHTVFCVEKGQKTYYDSQFQRTVSYSSGQQVKRSILGALVDELDVYPSPTTFVFEIGSKDDLGEGEVYSTCDPRYPDQLLGGWMKAVSGGKERTIKRRSPLSISAMRPLHPLLTGYTTENITFDRSDKPEVHQVKVFRIEDKKRVEIQEDELKKFLEGTDRSLRRKWIPNQGGSNARTSGLFIYDIAIDLRTLFCVSLNQDEPELSEATIEKLKELGWQENSNVFGKCLVCPEKSDEQNGIIGRDKIIPALAKALINWRITSNQSRTFSPMETLAVAISDNANKIAGAIRTKLVEEGETSRVKPIIEENLDGADVFVTLPCAGYIVTQSETADALESAENRLKELMLQFDFENQIPIDGRN